MTRADARVRLLRSLSVFRVPIPPPRSGGAYLQLERKVADFATTAMAVQRALGADGACEQGGNGLTNVGLAPIKAGSGGVRSVLGGAPRPLGPGAASWRVNRAVDRR